MQELFKENSQFHFGEELARAAMNPPAIGEMAVGFAIVGVAVEIESFRFHKLSGVAVLHWASMAQRFIHGAGNQFGLATQTFRKSRIDSQLIGKVRRRAQRRVVARDHRANQERGQTDTRRRSTVDLGMDKFGEEIVAWVEPS